MTTLENRPGTAVLVIDVQNGVLAGTHDRAGVVANIGTVVGKARRAGVPVVWVQHNSPEKLVAGEEPWKIVPELDPQIDEPNVQKAYPDSFEDTDLEKVLAGLGVGRLVVTGALSDCCVRATLHGGLVRGYDALLVSDAHTTEDTSVYGSPPPDQVVAHTNVYWKYNEAPGRTAGTVATADVEFA